MIPSTTTSATGVVSGERSSPDVKKNLNEINSSISEQAEKLREQIAFDIEFIQALWQETLNAKKMLDSLDSLAKIQQFASCLQPQEMGFMGGRKFIFIEDTGRVCLNDIIKRANAILKELNPVEKSKAKGTIRELLGRVKQLDEDANRELEKKSWFIKVMTKVKSFFGNLGFDRSKVLAEWEFFQHTVSSSAVMESKDLQKFEGVSEEEVLSLQGQIQVTNKKHPKLNLEELKRQGLLPKRKFQMGEVTYYCTDSFKIGSSNRAIIGLVKVGSEVYPRLFYQSNSQGTWRVVPVMIKGLVVRFGKGLSETDTQLPIALSLVLNSQPYLGKKERTLDLASDLVKTGRDFSKTWVVNGMVEPFAGLMQGAKGDFLVDLGRRILIPPDPKSIKLPEDRNLHPDFSCCVQTEVEVPHYGKLTAKVFFSKDKSLQYLFYEAEDGRAFLASVEKVKDNPINIFGVRKTCHELKSLDAPLLEYERQIPSDYKPTKDASRYQSDKYVSNWNYVRELAVIQMYYSEQGRKVPERV